MATSSQIKTFQAPPETLSFGLVNRAMLRTPLAFGLLQSFLKRKLPEIVKFKPNDSKFFMGDFKIWMLVAAVLFIACLFS